MSHAKNRPRSINAMKIANVSFIIQALVLLSLTKGTSDFTCKYHWYLFCFSLFGGIQGLFGIFMLAIEEHENAVIAKEEDNLLRITTDYRGFGGKLFKRYGELISVALVGLFVFVFCVIVLVACVKIPC